MYGQKLTDIFIFQRSISEITFTRTEKIVRIKYKYIRNQLTQSIRSQQNAKKLCH